ncbi:MAG: YggS family pyridoxal phosphate-dependent enzyme [bacterium]
MPVDSSRGPVLILASGSPRRRAFMEAAGIPVAIRPVDVTEVPRPGEGPLAFARRMAEEKALAGLGAESSLPWSLGCDTVVALGDRIFGKPADADEAAAMLADLAGHTHHVITAWSLAARAGGGVAGETTTAVTFRPLASAEIAAYVATGDPLDKAGAYGIQSGAGPFVVGVDGSYDGVVGLPLAEVARALEALGVVTFPFGLLPRLAALRGQVAAASVASGRAPDGVTLVGVSKGQPVEKLAAAVALGLSPLGENYVQEWKDKVAALGAAAPAWHFIGRVQRNKARFIAEHAERVHAVESVRAAEALGRAAEDAGRVLPILLQVDLADEPTKGGVAPGDAPGVVEAMHGVAGVRLDGLMAIPPAEAPEAARLRFAALRRLRDALATPAHPLPELSMGMSGDFREAIAEGATLVRVGTALFGGRS